MTSIVDSEGASAVIRSDLRGRMLVPADQREALLDEFERSGLSGMAFCRLHGLTYPTFATWVQKRRRRPAAQSAAFAEVVIESRAEAAAACDTPGLRLTLASGMTLEVTRRSFNGLHDARVGVHVRRRDFLGNSRHDLCRMPYFTTAIKLVRALFEDSRFLVISDDPRWCEEALGGEPDLIVAGPADVHEALMKLCSCGAFILFNSVWVVGSLGRPRVPCDRPQSISS